ncbi:MBL fold metallo-hydrolase [Paraflavisolibacter sp. H34]|uniref:MBL fold metallo-hydrolase n=1 Tax=Huijunlia imazamoxiresistens TaxID=3127457 RepID=UPI0030162671
MALIKKIMIGFLILVLVLVVTVFLYMRQPQFGKAPSGARLERIKRSPHFRDGQFHNLSHTPALTEGATYTGVLKQFLFGRNQRGTPADSLPSRKTDLLGLDPQEDILVWFGHSSYFLQVGGKRFLVDPVLSGRASPVWFTTRSFTGSDVYTVDELPPIDYLLLTHDHYDHLDYKTVVQLQPKVGTVITGLGVGAHLEYWGYRPDQIIEKDWNEEVVLDAGFTVHTAPARHFSGRGFRRNGTLWTSFVLTTPGRRIYLGGDSGYDRHFKTIGETYGPFDLVILENGQYDQNWKYIHMMPEETVQAARDLKARRLLPVHWSKFALANHAWDESIIRVVREGLRQHMPLLHPLIGEAVRLKDEVPPVNWWENVK